MLEKMADVFVAMPDSILEQLSGYDIVKHNKIILMTTKFESLLNKNVDVIETREVNNTENAQSADEIINYKADSSPTKYKSSTSTSVLTDNNNDMTTTGTSNDDVNNETKRENDNNNDIAANCRASTSKSFFNNNDTVVTVTNDNILDNDVNKTDISEGDNLNVLPTNYLASTSKSAFNHNDSSDKAETIRENIYNDSIQHSLASTSKFFFINNNDEFIIIEPQTYDVSTEKTTSEIHNDLIQQNVAVTSKSDDAVINHPPNNDHNNETETRERDINNDSANHTLAGPSISLFDNNDDIDFNDGLTNNDISKDTETREKDITRNNDVAANILRIKKEICDFPNDECVPRNKNSLLYDECIEISDDDSLSDSTVILKDPSDDDSSDETESTTVQPENTCDRNNDVVSMNALNNDNFVEKSSEKTRNSPPPTFDDDDDEEWKRLVDQLNGLDNDDLNENETDVTEEANVDSNI